MRVNLATLLLFALGLAVLSWTVAEPFWAYLVLGSVLAIVVHPVYRRIASWTRRPRLAAGLTISVTVLAVLLPLGLVAWRIVVDIQHLTQTLTVVELSHALGAIMESSHAAIGYPQQVSPDAGRELLDRIVPEVRQRLGGWAVTALTSAVSFALGLVITVLVMYYGLVQGGDFAERLKRASPMDDELEQAFLDEATGTVHGVVMGQLLTAVLQGLLGFLAFFVAGIPSPFFWGFLMAMLSFLPVVGAFLVWFPAGIYLVATGQPALGVGVLVWGVAVISTVDNVVKPVVIGRRAHVHPLLAFVGVLGGLSAFGFLGFLIGPLVLSLAAAVFNVLVDTDWEAVGRGEPDGVPAARDVAIGQGRGSATSEEAQRSSSGDGPQPGDVT